MLLDSSKVYGAERKFSCITFSSEISATILKNPPIVEDGHD